jgi:hypothetical protein
LILVKQNLDYYILQGEIIAADPNSNKGHLLKLNNDLLYDKKETIILPFQPDLKFIHQILQKIKPMSNNMRSVLWRRYKLGISLSKIKTILVYFEIQFLLSFKEL